MSSVARSGIHSRERASTDGDAQRSARASRVTKPRAARAIRALGYAVRMRIFLVSPHRVAPVLFAVALTAQAAPPVAAPALLTPAEKTAARQIRPEVIRGHVRYLASDLLEGRGPASRGDQLAEQYIAAQMEGLGLEPAAPGGGWFQPFDVVGIASEAPATVRFTKNGQSVEARYRDDYVAFSGVERPDASTGGGEVVFVGYGIVAPEYQWDDFKGVDLKGKVLLIMNNDPEDDPKLFAGKTRLYYGRWDYKYAMAAKVGAAGAIVIHTTPSAGYPWQVVQTSWSGEQFALPHENEPEVAIKAWVTEDVARKIARLGGQDLDALRASAQKRDFKPVSLGVAADITLKNTVQRKQTGNVIGRLPGRDPALAREAVVYTAHHDHLGVKEGAKPGQDNIYNGALDNASGVAAMLTIAKAMMALPQPPRRSVIFAAVAAEEQGLLGSKYMAAHPPIPAGRIAADINIDGVNIWGRTRDITMVGLGKSSLDDTIVKLAGMQGRVVVPDQFPDRGFFYRSDQFSLAQVGVPAAYFDAGTDVIGKPPGWGKEQQEKFEASDYHQPSDELRPEWELSGAVEDAQLFFYLGIKVASAPEMPRWKPGDEFEAARKKAIAEAR
jgi:Zn-dependent M28 family amino/carboxypeptidase